MQKLTVKDLREARNWGPSSGSAHFSNVSQSFGEKLSLMGVHYHFKLTSVHYVKSTKKILAGVRTPSPFLAMPGFSQVLVQPPLPKHHQTS